MLLRSWHHRALTIDLARASRVLTPWCYERPWHLRPSAIPIRLALTGHLSSSTQNRDSDRVNSPSHSFRQITFPDSWKGRRAEREAHAFWVSFWRTVPNIDKPLIFRINDKDESNLPRITDVTREGITFPKGDLEGERYWRLSHPVSLLTRLRQFRWRLRGDTWSSLPLKVRRWLYGGPSLGPLAKVQWLISGPSPHPWIQRSRWIRWPVYALVVYMLSATVFIGFNLEPTPVTGRLRFVSLSRADYIHALSTRKRQAEVDLHTQIKNLRPPDALQKRRLGDIFNRLLLACGLCGTKWRLLIVDDPDNPNACISPFGQVILWTGLLNVMSSDDELAAVLSHELSHTLMEHPREALSIAALRRALAVPLLPMLVGGFYARRLFLTAATTYISSGLLAFYLSRRKEEEADYVGMLLMAEAGFDPASRTASWEKMVGWKNSAGIGLLQAPAWLSTHPTLASRIRKSSEWAPKVQSITHKDKEHSVDSSNRPENGEELEERWKDFLAGNAERRSMLP